MKLLAIAPSGNFLNRSLHLNQVAVDGTSRDNEPLEDCKATCGDDEDSVAAHFN